MEQIQMSPEGDVAVNTTQISYKDFCTWLMSKDIPYNCMEILRSHSSIEDLWKQCENSVLLIHWLNHLNLSEFLLRTVAIGIARYTQLLQDRTLPYLITPYPEFLLALQAADSYTMRPTDDNEHAMFESHAMAYHLFNDMTESLCLSDPLDVQLSNSLILRRWSAINACYAAMSCARDCGIEEEEKNTVMANTLLAIALQATSAAFRYAKSLDNTSANYLTSTTVAMRSQCQIIRRIVNAYFVVSKSTTAVATFTQERSASND